MAKRKPIHVAAGNKAKDASAAPKHITKLGNRLLPLITGKAKLRKEWLKLRSKPINPGTKSTMPKLHKIRLKKVKPADLRGIPTPKQYFNPGSFATHESFNAKPGVLAALDELDVTGVPVPMPIPTTPDGKRVDWRDPIMYNLQTDLAVQRKIIDDLRRQEALLRTELQHKNIFIDLLLKERDKS